MIEKNCMTLPKRRLLLGTLGAVGLAALIPGCGYATSPLRIATNPWVGYEFLFLARHEGWISPQDTVLVEAGSATGALELLASGKADGAALTLDEMLRARDQGLPLMAVLVFDISVGADVLLAKPGIESLAQLKGKRIGFEQSAVGALMLHKVLEAAGLQAGDVGTVPVTFDRHIEVWQSGKVDALITFEPASSRLQAEGARRLFDSSRIPDTILDVLAVTPAAAKRHHEALHRLVAAHFRGLTAFHKNPYDTAYRMAERFKLPPKEVIAAFKGLEIPNASRNRKFLHGENSVIAKVANDLGVIMAQAGLLKNSQIDSSNLVTTDFIPWEETR
jgi:NitT/TauT family transport system substrate-binding protein